MSPTEGKPISEETEIRVSLARFETKLDLVIDEHGRELGDHEKRLRTLEGRRVVTPSGLLAAAVGSVAILGGSIAFIDRLTGIA